MKIVLLGSSEMLLSMIDGVLQTDAEIVGVMNWKHIHRRTFKDFVLTDYTQAKIKSLKLPEIQAKSANSPEFRRKLLELSPDILLVGTWGEKIKKEIFDIPKIASVNIHPSLLPKYRGANPYSRAIMFGEEKTGITFHLMSEKFDAGAILLQKEFAILKTDNANTLKQRLCKNVEPMCIEFINYINSDIFVPVEQDETQMSYYPHVKPYEIVVAPEIMTYDEIHNKIRGLAPWQSTYLFYRGEYFKIYDYMKTTHYIKQHGCNICLKTKDEKFIYFANLRAFGTFKRYFTSRILKNLHR